MNYTHKLRQIKLGLLPKEAVAKERKPIAKKSAKRIEQDKVDKASGSDNELDVWFKNSRKKLSGFCKCGCNKPSSKNDDKYYKCSCSHLFPKSKFESIKTHPLNFVERAFWGGCHSVLDDTSMDRWVDMADWNDIVEKFHLLAPLLTDEERSKKFYLNFEKLIYENRKTTNRKD